MKTQTQTNRKFSKGDKIQLVLVGVLILYFVGRFTISKLFGI